jgi:glycosyltransferase involved in cell wall biosynthesis
MIRDVPHGAVGNYHRAADLFVHASLHESAGLAALEAMARGSTVIAHDGDAARELLGTQAILRNLAVAGEGTRVLRTALASPASVDARYRRWRHVRDRFGWQALREPYARMFEQVMAAPRGRGA